MKKASAKNSVAMYNLAAMHSDQDAPLYNIKSAFEYFTKAADGGVVDAMYFLSKFYIKGEIVPKDNIKAYKWMKHSIKESGFSSDIDLVHKRQLELKELEKKLTPEQIAAVNKELGYKN